MLVIIIYSVALLLFIACMYFLWKAAKHRYMSVEQQSVIFLQATLGALLCVMTIGVYVANKFSVSEMPTGDPNALLVFMLTINAAYIIFRRYRIDGTLTDMPNMRIQTRLLLIVMFFQFAIIGSLGSMVYFYRQADELALAQAQNGLYAIANSRASHLAAIIKDSKDLVAAYALNSDIVACLENIGPDKRICDSKGLGDMIEGAFKKNSTLKLGVILDKNGTVVGSSDNTLLGQDWSQTKEFKERSGNGYHSDIVPANDNYNAAGMITISQVVFNHNVFLGMVVVRISPEEYYAVVEDRVNLGDTGESVIVDSRGKLLSPRRFTNEVFTTLNTPDANKCSSDFAENVTKTADGVEMLSHNNIQLVFFNNAGRKITAASAVVTGAVGDSQWCVLVEMGEDEIRAPLRARLIKMMVVALIFLLTLIVVLTKVFDYYFDRSECKER